MTRPMTVDINRQATGVLEKVAREQAREPTQIIRRAIGWYAHCHKEYYGQTITIIDEKGNKKQYYFN